MTTSLLPAVTLDELMSALTHASAWVEAGVLMTCLVLAWGVIRLARGRQGTPGSVWFGERIVDGVLFPALALALAFGARRLLPLLGVAPALFKIFVPVLLSFAVIRLSVRVFTAAFPHSRVMRTLERTISWLAWLAVVGWLTGVLPVVLEELDAIQWKLGAGKVSVRSIIEGALLAGFVLVLALWVSAAIEARLLRGAYGEQLSLRKAGANIVRALLTFVGLMVALSAVGIDLTAFSVLGGAIGVGLGFGLQKLASNYVSGFVILAERSLRIGDMVKVDGFEGRITDIATRYTVIRALNGREAIVPNELLITQRVENSSLADPKVMLNTNVQVAYGTDLVRLRPALRAAVAGVARVMDEPEPAVHLSAFASDGLDLQIVFWIADPENGTWGVRSDVNLAVLACLQREGVEIPFPQRVVRVAGGAGLPAGEPAEALAPPHETLPPDLSQDPKRDPKRHLHQGARPVDRSDAPEGAGPMPEASA